MIKAIGLSFLIQETAIAVHYYRRVGTGRGELIEGQYKYRWFQGKGSYFPAPLWEPEVGVITSPSQGCEFTIRHEVGHSLYPTRVLYCAALTPVFLYPGWKSLLWVGSALWLGIALSERFADHYALQNCSLEGLEEAFVEFDRHASQPRFQPLDVHPTNAQRAYAVRNRIAQLQASTKAPIEIALPIYTLFAS